MRIVIVILALFLGCSASKDKQTVESNVKAVDDFSIIGKWKFEWVKPIGDFEEWFNSDRETTMGLYSFFGATAFSELTDKTIEITSDNKIKTDWFEQAIIDKIQFEYQLFREDSLLVFTVVSPKDESKIEMPTIMTFDSDVMIWNIENIKAVKLVKIE